MGPLKSMTTSCQDLSDIALDTIGAGGFSVSAAAQPAQLPTYSFTIVLSLGNQFLSLNVAIVFLSFM